MTTRFRTIIGSNHGKPHSRIWLEGDRLIEAGFTVGTRYHRAEHADRILLIASTEGKYKVSGKGTKPIIDLTGAIVARVFPKPLTHVSVQFHSATEQLITITA